MSEVSSPATTDDVRQVAATLAEALPYAQRHAGHTFVIKYGGAAMGNPVLQSAFARDIVLLKQVGIHPVVVHGGGPQIGAMLERLKIKSTFVDGLRVTDRQTAEVVEMVLSGRINKQIVSDINQAGGRAVGLSGKDAGLFHAEPLNRKAERDPESTIERVLDYGFVGRPVEVDGSILDLFSQSDVVPVIAPVGGSQDGETFNINADTVAGEIAIAVQAARLYVLTDVPGVRGVDGNLLPAITAAEAQRLIDNGIVTGGMIPKVRMCMNAVQAGVGAATILDGTTAHTLLVEVFTKAGGGTMVRTADQ